MVMRKRSHAPVVQMGIATEIYIEPSEIVKSICIERFGRVLGPTAPGEPEQQRKLSVEQCTRLRTLDVPAPGIRDVERAADLTRTTVCHIEESSRIASIAPTALRKVVRDATRGALDLICRFWTVLPKLG